MQEIITTAQAARMLGRSVATVNRMVALGQIQPAKKLPGKTGAYLFEAREIERLVSDRAAS
jgi:hypothetical protein